MEVTKQKPLSTYESLLVNFLEMEKGLNGQKESDLHKIRKAAMEAFEKVGLPDSKTELYKYTGITKALDKNLDLTALPAETQLSVNNVKDLLLDIDAHHIVLNNGIFDAQASQVGDTSFRVEDLENKLVNDTSSLSKFAKLGDFEINPFYALNTAFHKSGIFLSIPKNTVVEKPIIIYQVTNATVESGLSQPRVLINSEGGSQATILEVTKTQGDNLYFNNSVAEVYVSGNAHLNFYKVQNEHEKAHHVESTYVYQEGDSTFTSLTLTLSGGIIRNNLNIASDGSGCNSNMYGLYLGKGKSHFDNNTSVDHLKPHAESNELYKGVLDDQSTGIFNGRIYVRQDAQKTNAFQSNKNILLSETATVNTKPQLEIWADDVKCSHGCTTGRLDDEQLFYLRARGLDKDQARSLLLKAFALEVIETVNNETIHSFLEELIEHTLNK